MTTNHYNLFKKVQLIYIIAGEAIKFFNKDLLEDQKRNGLRICFTERGNGEDILNICVGIFPVEKSEKYFDCARKKAKLVSGENAPLTTIGNEKYTPPVPQGGVQGFLYGVGVAGQEEEHNEVIAGAIILIIEKILFEKTDDKLKPAMIDHSAGLKSLFDQPGRNENFNKFMNYLINEQRIFQQVEFLELME